MSSRPDAVLSPGWLSCSLGGTRHHPHSVSVTRGCQVYYFWTLWLVSNGLLVQPHLANSILHHPRSSLGAGTIYQCQGWVAIGFCSVDYSVAACLTVVPACFWVGLESYLLISSWFLSLIRQPFELWVLSAHMFFPACHSCSLTLSASHSLVPTFHLSGSTFLLHFPFWHP